MTMTIKIFADITDKRMKTRQQQQQQQQKKRTFLYLLRRQKISFLFGVFVVVVLVNNINHPPPTINTNNKISINDNDNNNKRQREEDNDDIEAYAKRLNYYKERYRYQPPHKRPTDDDDDYQRYVTNLCGPSPEFPNYFAQRKWDRSQFLEDMTLYKLLFKSNNNNDTDDQNQQQQQQRKVQKTFVELGAYDGKHWSNTRFFEYCLNWSPGILIEASQGIYPKLVEQRPFTHRFNFAPSCINGMENNSTLTFEATNRPASGIATDDNTTTSNKEEETVEVPCGPLGPILEDFIMKDHPDGITLFSLDVEKSEPTVLKTIDFDKIKVDVWIIECFDCRKEGSTIPESAIETRQIMKSHNYKRYEGVITHSDLFIHQDSPYQLPPSSNIKEVE